MIQINMFLIKYDLSILSNITTKILLSREISIEKSR